MLGRRIVMVLAIVILSITSSLRLASAGPQIVAHCCCGTHDVADDCGCPDCPSAHASDSRRQTTPGPTSMKRCGVEGSLATQPVLPVFAAATATMIVELRAAPPPVFHAPAPARAPDPEPPLDPPR